jgi:glycosyltransferase involved in cell wall biosynthesis
MMRILAALIDHSPSTILNILTPLKYLDGRGDISLQAVLEREITPAQVADADVIVTSRSTEPAFRPIYQLAHDLGIPVIYDLDDNLLDLPPDNLSWRYHSNPARKAQLEWMLRTAALVRVHSPVLQDIIQPYNSHVDLVWAAIDWNLVPSELPLLASKPIKIVYAAQRESGEKLFPLIHDAIESILQRYGDRVQVSFLGFNPRDLLRYPQVVQVPFESDYEAYFRNFTREGYAIGLAPMLPDTFFQCKTDLKFRDYAAAGAAGLYSDCQLYINRITNRETGLLVSNTPDAWLKGLIELIENPTLIEQIRVNARRYAADRYNMEKVGAMWMDSFAKVPPRPLVNTTVQRQVESIRWHFRADSPRWLQWIKQHTPRAVRDAAAKIRMLVRRDG